MSARLILAEPADFEGGSHPSLLLLVGLCGGTLHELGYTLDVYKSYVGLYR